MIQKQKIYIVIATHKNYQMPEDKIYLPVHVGAEGKDLDLGFVKDNTGENISKKNDSFCELTGLFWAWKNIDCEYLGLVHYRRHFMREKKGKDPFKNILNTKEIEDLIKKYRMILPQKRKYYIETLYSHYAHTHYAEHLEKTRDILAEKYKKYLEAFDKVMNDTSGYMFNMMIMEKGLLDQYCEWLFDILFELEKVVSKSQLSQYQGRFFGRVSEIIFNVWLRYQLEQNRINEKEIIELPCIYMEDIYWRRKIFSFLRAKFSGRKYEGSF